MAINYADADYVRGTGVIEIGQSGLVNLNVLGTTNAGPGTGEYAPPYTSGVSAPNDTNNQLNIGEQFILSRAVKTDFDGTNESATYTMRGTGTYTPTSGTPHDVIIADRTTSFGATESVIIFPYSDAPTTLLGEVGNIVALNLTTRAVGWDFDVNAPLCFARGTMLDTPEGLRAIESLKAGDLVLTRDNGPQPIRWIGSRMITAKELSAHEKLRPIRIKAGALGAGTPAADLVVSPQHRVLVRSKVAIRMFGAAEVLVAAKQLLQVDGIDICDKPDEVEYFHMLFDRHEVVFANGAEAESLYTGPEAIKSVGPAALEEIYEILPELRERDYKARGARELLSGRMGRKLVSRHLQHNRPLVAAL